MLQPENFICISYSKIDFLIPNDDVFTAVSMTDFDSSQLSGALNGVYNIDEFAIKFNEEIQKKNVCTMIIIKKDDGEKLSIITTRECLVCKIPLNQFSLFSDSYSKGLNHHGILACNFENGRARYLLNIQKVVDYINVPETKNDAVG